MADKVTSPEWVILERTVKELKKMAAERQFIRSGNEAVRSVFPSAVLRWITLEGGEQNTNFMNIPKPCMLVTPMPVKESPTGTACANDAIVTIVIQAVDDNSSSRQSSGPVQSYMDWMNRIRNQILGNPMIFRQDFNPAVADPYGVWAKDRIPADPQRFWRHQQAVSAFSFFVKVRQHRSAGGQQP